jgi:hypothetical protein
LKVVCAKKNQKKEEKKKTIRVSATHKKEC